MDEVNMVYVTIIEDTRTLLLQTKLPLRFWTYAARAATNVRNCLYNKNVGESPLMNISKHKMKITLRSFLPFGAPAMILDHTVHKTKAPGKRAITLSKDPRGFGYYFYIPKDKKIISSTNYVLPNYTVDHGETAKGGQQDIIGTFLDETKEKIGNLNDIEFDEKEILASLPPDDVNLEDIKHSKSSVEFDEVESRILQYLIANDNTEQSENYIHPKEIDNMKLDNIYEEIDDQEDDPDYIPEVEVDVEDITMKEDII